MAYRLLGAAADLGRTQLARLYPDGPQALPPELQG